MVKTITIPEIKVMAELITNMKHKRVGILGGTFNPPHLGHLIIAEQVKSQLNLDEVMFIPDYQPPHIDKKTAIFAEKRLKMVKLSTMDEPEFKVSDIELRRKGVSYTIDTIKELKLKNPEVDYYFIIGGDMVEYLPKWHRIEELIKLVKFVGVGRPGYRKESKYPIMWVDVPMTDISSTLVRRNVKQGCSIKYLVTPEVENYIHEEGLYRE